MFLGFGSNSASGTRLVFAAGLAALFAASVVLLPGGFVSPLGGAAGPDFAAAGFAVWLDLLRSGLLAVSAFGAAACAGAAFERGAVGGFAGDAPSSGTSTICPLEVTGGLPFAGVAAGVDSPVGRAIDAGWPRRLTTSSGGLAGAIAAGLPRRTTISSPSAEGGVAFAVADAGAGAGVAAAAGFADFDGAFWAEAAGAAPAG